MVYDIPYIGRLVRISVEMSTCPVARIHSLIKSKFQSQSKLSRVNHF